MADPRKAFTNRIGTNPEKAVTYQVDGVDIVYEAGAVNGSSKAGLAVMLSGDGVVRLTADASPVLGKLIHVEPDGYCAVLVEGVVTLPGGTAAVLTVGTKIVGALSGTARGYIRSQAAITLAEVAVANHRIENATPATAVQVLLGAG